jgi:hypothetical protein
MESGLTLKGSVTHVSFDEIYGWARFSDIPFLPPLVQATVDGVVVAEALADLFHEPFAYLGLDATYCAFMLDLSNSAISHTDRVLLLAGGKALPGGTLYLPRRPSEQEIFVEDGGIAHVFAYRVGKYNISSKQPLRTVWVYSRSRYLAPDRRRLGALIGSVFADGVEVDLLAPRSFAEGFHDPVDNAVNITRWTDGKARLQFPAGGQPHSLSFEIFVLAANKGQV